MTKKKANSNKLTKIFEFILDFLSSLNVVLFIGLNLDKNFSNPPIFNAYSKILSIILFLSFLSRIYEHNFSFKMIRKSILDFILSIIFFISPVQFFPLILISATGRQIYIFLRRLSTVQQGNKIFKRLSANPAFYFILSFIVVILAGTILLSLPISNIEQRPFPLLDACFTATSATCVTGLSVISTGGFF